VPDTTPQDPTLWEAASRYLATLSAEVRQESQPEVHKFVRWYGGDRRVGELRGPDVAAYAETFGSSSRDAGRRLEPVRSFLAFAKKAGLTPVNLSTHVRVRKGGPAPAPSGPAVAPRQVHLTAEGRAALEAELETLRARRPEVADELRRAMADKDFRENAPLDAARDAQAHLEGRIRELEATLSSAEIIESEVSQRLKAKLGSTLVLANLGSGTQVRYTLVGPDEASPAQGKISVVSPVGKALVDREAGEEVEVAAPAGRLRFRIERIER
jgi:transcription elongation factor GreA